MSSIDDLYDLYDRNLSGRTFTVAVREIGGSTTGEYLLRFQDYQASHLIGEDSDWHAKKVEAFKRLCYTSGWKMVGEYVESMGVYLDADILVGGQNGFFGFRYDEDEDDGTYYPCTCMLADIRDHSYHPLWKVEYVEEDWD